MPDTDTRDQIADMPRQLPADALEQLHVADLFGEATPPGVTLDASSNQKPTNGGDDVHTNVRRGLDDCPILTWVGQGYDQAEAAMLLADECEHTPPALPIMDSSLPIKPTRSKCKTRWLASILAYFDHAV